MHHDNKDKEKRRAAGQKSFEHIMIESLAEAGITGATVWTGVSGIGKRGKSTVNLEALTIIICP
ncbi:MAG TPA: hypothetical protein VJP79_10245 [Nitrososphaera sp.]|nr:hypothetical protein [Nitrososphaera sp.]